MHAFLPDVRLAPITWIYGIMDTAMPPVPITVHQLLVFNLSGAKVTGDADGFDAPIAACAMTEGGRMLGKGEGRMVFVYLLAGTLSRVLGLDATTLTDPRPVAPGESAALDAMLAELMKVRDDRGAIVKTIDAHLLDAMRRAPPQGLAERANVLLVGSDAPSVPDTAKRLGVSQRTLERHYKTRYGCAPSRYLRHLRLIRATPGRVQDWRWENVPPEIEYSDQSHWLKDIRTIYGATPTQLRNMELAEWFFYPDDRYDPSDAIDAFVPEENKMRIAAWKASREELVADLPG